MKLTVNLFGEADCKAAWWSYISKACWWSCLYICWRSCLLSCLVKLFIYSWIVLLFAFNLDRLKFKRFVDRPWSCQLPSCVVGRVDHVHTFYTLTSCLLDKSKMKYVVHCRGIFQSGKFLFAKVNGCHNSKVCLPLPICLQWVGVTGVM